MAAYYNEFDPNAAAWLRELIKNGLIADGEVDERSITDVQADELRGFTQHHFFAGIGGWSYALRIAGVPDSYPVWTASLPCQPFSAAGLGKGKGDERHLLPHFLELVRQCQPDRIFGEQVEGAIRHGWLDDLQTTMEAEDYTVGHCVLGAHSVNAPHQRQRLYWVANSMCGRQQGQGELGQSLHPAQDKNREVNRTVNVSNISDGDKSGRMGDTEHNGHLASEIKGSNGAPVLSIEERTDSTSESKGTGSSRIISSVIGMGDAESNKEHTEPERGLHPESGNERDSSLFADIEWLYCRDNKYRPIKSGLKPLVDGIPRGMVRSGDNGEPINANETQEARSMRLKGYGNAIVPQVAATFIKAFMEINNG